MSVNVPPPPPPPTGPSPRSSAALDGFESIDDFDPPTDTFSDWDKAFDYRPPLDEVGKLLVTLDMKRLTIDFEKKKLSFPIPSAPGAKFSIEVREPRKRTDG